MATSLGQSVGRLADRTPSDRDRVVDAVRAASIVVVIVWHWSLSINHRDGDGQLRNPNPIPEVPYSWLLTWLLQVMPLFFVVGGFANRRGWRSTLEHGDGVRTFWARRARRLLAPVAVFVAVWAVIDLAGWLLFDDYRFALDVAPIVFMPMWFVAAYAWVVAMAPLTATLHDQRPVATFVALASMAAAVDVVRFGFGADEARWLNLVLVWLVIHQIGYFWSDGTLFRWGPRGSVVLAGCGLLGLAVLTALPAYPGSLVATPDDDVSHMYPPTALLPVVALFQVGLITAAYGPVTRWLRNRRAWMAVVGVNTVILTIFLWHMTALLGAIVVVEAFGATLGEEATWEWWLLRPLWVIGPAVLLVPLVAMFAWVETGRRR